MSAPAGAPKLTEAQRKRLAVFPRKTFEFPKTASQERFAFDMMQAGLLERSWDMYSYSRGGASAQFRWAYRLTDAGRAALKGAS